MEELGGEEYLRMSADSCKISIVMESYDPGFEATLSGWLRERCIETSPRTLRHNRLIFSITNRDAGEIVDLIANAGPDGLYRAFVSSADEDRTIRGRAYETENALRNKARGIHMPLGAKPSEIARSRSAASRKAKPGSSPV